MYVWGDGVWGDGVWGGPSPAYIVTALPMDTTTLQSAQATAGVRAEGQAMETSEWGEARALGLDGDRVIPVPNYRAVIPVERGNA